jgi:hypothetical protein
MAGLLDWLFADPNQRGGGFLAQLLDATPAAGAPMARAPVPPIASQAYSGLLGASPFANAVRGGLAGLVASNGYRGATAIGAGMLGAERYAQQRRDAARQDALGDLDLARLRGATEPAANDPSEGGSGCHCEGRTASAPNGAERLQSLAAELQRTPEGRAILQRLAAEIAASRQVGSAQSQ